MKIRSLGIVVALLSSAGMVRADTTTALGQCVSACQLEAACSTQKCANLCELSCKHDITQPQHVFNGPVTSTPLVCTGGADTQCGFFVSGTVANQAFCPGTVTIYQICPGDRGTSILASGTVNADCTFSFTAPTGPGQNGCYGLIAVAPPVATTGGPDPGWSTCTGSMCPAV